MSPAEWTRAGRDALRRAGMPVDLPALPETGSLERGWTRHGHPIPGLVQRDPRPRVMRCGAVAHCLACQDDVAAAPAGTPEPIEARGVWVGPLDAKPGDPGWQRVDGLLTGEPAPEPVRLPTGFVGLLATRSNVAVDALSDAATLARVNGEGSALEVAASEAVSALFRLRALAYETLRERDAEERRRWERGPFGPGEWRRDPEPVDDAATSHPCGHAERVRGCGGCDPGAIEFVIDADGTVRAPEPHETSDRPEETR